MESGSVTWPFLTYVTDSLRASIEWKKIQMRGFAQPEDICLVTDLQVVHCTLTVNTHYCIRIRASHFSQGSADFCLLVQYCYSTAMNFNDVHKAPICIELHYITQLRI